MSIQALREQRAAKAKALHELVNKADYDPAKDNAAFDAAVDELNALDERIERIEKANELAADKAISDKLIDGAQRKAKDEQNPLWNIVAKWLAGGDRAINDAEMGRIFATMSTTTPGEGGYTVATEVAKSVIDAMKDFGGMREVSTILRMAKGNPMSLPTSDGTAEIGEIVAENAAVSDQDPSFGTIGLPVYKYSSKGVAVPFELLQDSEVDIEAFVRTRLRMRLGRITNTHFTVGTGVNQPRGLVTAATAGKVGSTGQTTTIVYDDLVDLEHSVDPAYRKLMTGTDGFMMHDTLLRNIRKIKDASGLPIFNPGYTDGTPGKAPDRIMGWPVTVNQDMPAPAANAKSAVFGQLSLYTIRDVMDVELFRFTDSVYTRKGQVGFLAFMRSGGNLVDAGAGVKYYQHSAT